MSGDVSGGGSRRRQAVTRLAALGRAGQGYEHAVDVHGHGRLTGVFAPLRAARGAQVGLRLDTAGCHVFAEPAAEA